MGNARMRGAGKADVSPASGDKFERLKVLLREMFQLDRGDLDFGLYRIMNMKADEIESFLGRDLLPQVKGVLAGVSDEDRRAREQALAKARKAARQLGVDPDAAPKVVELQEQLAEAKADANAEADVYGHLANFFARYYHEGDFMPLRRYTSGGRTAYLLPYDGEEVKLHWANADQYYIKTTENYACYAFTVGEGENFRRVRFEVAAADNEKDNIKEADGKQRRFVLVKGKGALQPDGDNLVVRFEHRPLAEAEKKTWPGNGAKQQERINAESAVRIRDALDSDWRRALSVLAPTEANPERTLLAKHIERYTAKNSFDYFIHKDIGGFLRRELDLYLKTDVLNLDDLVLGDADRLRRALGRMRAVRHAGEKIIAFLAQLEDFQKRLWLKKKFVLETQWCVTLDRAPEALYPEIAANAAQREEWVALFAIDEIAGDLGNGGAGYSEPLSTAFLKTNPHLVLDTRHFDADFRDRLLAALSDAGSLDEQSDGLLIHGENFQALNLLRARYDGEIDCIYVDPPFNTSDGDFAYKDNYRSSSWLSAMSDRIMLSRNLLQQRGQFISHIDENESESLHRLLEKIFGIKHYFGAVIWNKRNPKGDARDLAVQHESILWAARNAASLSPDGNDLKRPKKNAAAMVDTARKFTKTSKSIDEAREKYSNWLATKKFSEGELAYRYLDEKGRIFREVSMAWPNKKQAPESYFKPLIHPVTGKPCSVPKRGWRNTPGKMKKLLDKGLVAFGPDETTQPRRKYYLDENMFENISSVFEFGGSSDAEAQSLGISFETMKPLTLAKYLCNCESFKTFLDYFAGSGTTGHAVIDLSRENDERRRFILIEMADYFDTVLLPRIKKVVYASNWKNGKPVSRDKGVSQLIKYVRLESYEDTLDGLVLTPPDDDLLAGNAPALVEDYRLRYALGAETAASPCLLGSEFVDPFSCTLSVVRDGARQEIAADLPETFNFLLGLRVHSRRRLDGVLAISGKDPQGRMCLVLWRNLETMGNEALENWFGENRPHFPEGLDLVYVNGDHTLNAIRQSDETWTAETIEPLFRELLFENDGQ